MIAALLTEFNKPLQLTEVTPTTPAYGQVLVEVLCAGICGAQLAEIRGDKNPEAPLPRLLGHEACVRVLETGVGVRNVKIGDKCVAHWRIGAGAESDFPRYNLHGKEITSGKITCFSQMALISENRLTVVPEETPNELCALLGCGLSTALGVIERDAQLMFGESVLVVGCGGVGLNLIRAARLRGAGLIIGMDNAEKRQEVVDAGASAFSVAGLGLHKENYEFDVIIDTSGNPSTIAEYLHFLAPSGRFVMVGQPGPKQAIMMHEANHFFAGSGKHFRATQGGGFTPHMDIPRYVSLWKRGALDLEKIVSHKFGLDSINYALDLVRQGNAGRVLIYP